MRKLDECRAGVSEIKDALRDMERELQGWAKLPRYIRIGRMLIVAPVKAVDVSLAIPFSELLPSKKTFVQRLLQATPRRKHLAERITEVFHNSGYGVRGGEVLDWIRTFTAKT